MSSAARYAQALFQLAEERKQQPAVAGTMAALQPALQDESIAAALANPRLQPAQRLKFAAAVSKSVKAPAVLEDTLKLIARNNRLSILPQIVAAYQTLADAASGTARVQLTTAAALTEAQRTQLKVQLQKHLGAKSVQLEEQVDASLIGGFRAFFAGQVWDTSVSGNLARLSAKLKSSLARRNV